MRPKKMAKFRWLDELASGFQGDNLLLFEVHSFEYLNQFYYTVACDRFVKTELHTLLRFCIVEDFEISNASRECHRTIDKKTFWNTQCDVLQCRTQQLLPVWKPPQISGGVRVDSNSSWVLPWVRIDKFHFSQQNHVHGQFSQCSAESHSNTPSHTRWSSLPCSRTSLHPTNNRRMPAEI